MDARNVKTAEDARALIAERGLSHVKVALFDTDGVARGKYMSAEKFLSALDGGFGFCDVVLGWDSNDQLYDKATFTGWHTAYPDAPVRVLPETCRELEGENTVLFLAEFAGDAEVLCPRGLLRRVAAKAADMGYAPRAACEFEFFLFDETPDTVRDKHYADLKPITPGFFGYSMLRNTVHSDFYEALLNLCEQMDFSLEGLHTETGPGVLEAAIAHDHIVSAADKAALFKTYTKTMAQKRGWMATFMARWSPDFPGQSGHLHLSLGKKDGGSAFFDEAATDTMSDEMRWFIGGQQKLMPDLLSMVASTVNSFSRLVPGFWAPTSASWGVENRTCALRAIPGSAKSQRVEYRIAAADINPYIALSAALGSGLWGIEHKIEPTDPIVGNAYEREFPPELRLPSDLSEAAGRLRTSKPARDLFGDAFVDHYAQSREWEDREFRRAITDWELSRYFEII